MMGLSTSGALVMYLFVLFFFTYTCMIADPEKSPMARQITQQLPRLFWATLRRIVGQRISGVLDACADYFLVLVYLIIVLGCWSIMFTYGYDLITISKHISNVNKYIGYLTFGACISSWRYASTSPGIITARTMAKFDHYPYDDLLFTERLCPTLKIRKLAR